MLKKINRRKQMDPKRIYNYNKFLTTLDHKTDLKLNPNSNPTSNLNPNPVFSEILGYKHY
jgi:hypothetical protein